MALPNGDLITTVFDPQMAYPVDKRMQVDTLNSRDSISMYIRWEGMTVYVLEDSKIYILQGGRSNEYWKELGTGSGTGGTTFVGQFETDDLLPTSGRSAGDYAFVGTGEDFVQYNWDNIANEWVIQAETNLSAFDFYQNGRKTIYVKGPKDIIITDEGNIVTYPEFMGNLVFTKPFNLRGVVDALGDKEFTIENSSGEPGTIEANYVGGPANSAFNIPETITIQNGEKLTFKSEDGEWVLSQNTGEVAFSDRLDAVGAIRTIGPDGLEVITGVFDKNTGKEVSFKEYEDTPAIVDGTIFIQLNGKYFADSEFLSTRKISAKKLGVTTLNSPGTNRANFSAAIRLCAKLRATLEITEDIEIDNEIYMTGEDSGVIIKGSGMAKISRSDISSVESTRGGILFIAATPEYGVPTDIEISNLVLDGNKLGIDKSSGTGIFIYDTASVITDPQNISIRNVRVRNMKSNGINVLGKGVLIADCFVHDNDFHGISTNPGSDKVTYSNTFAYNNSGGYGLDVSGGECIVTNLWSFNNGQGGMKLSEGTGKFIGDNLVLEGNNGPGFQQTGSSPDAVIQIGSILCKDNTNFGLSLTDGKVRSVQSAVCINNNTAGIAAYDNRFSDAKIEYLYIEQSESISGNTMYCTGNTQIGKIHYKNCDGVLNTATNSFVGVYSGIVENTNGYFINRTGNVNATYDLHNIKFIDTTVGNTQATAIRIVNDNQASIFNCDFTANPGPKVEIHQTSDVLVKDCRGFSHSAAISTTNYTFLKGDRHRYLKFTGSSGNNTVPPDTFEAGDEIKGEVQGATKTITAGAGVTLRGGELKVNQGQRFSIKFESPTDALVTVYMSTQVEKATWIETATDISGAPTHSFHLYNRISEDFTGSPDDGKDWFIRRVMGNANTVAVDTAIDRDTGQMFSRAYTSGAWTGWVGAPVILNASPTLDFGSISAGSAAILTATVTGAELGDVVAVSAPASVYTSNDCTVDAWVSDVDEVSVRVINNGASGVDPDEGTYKIKVFK